MNIRKIDSTNINFGQLKIDPDSNVILKPIRKKLNSLAQNCDVQITKFTSQLGDYTDNGIIVKIAAESVKSKNFIKNYLYRITGANYPAVTRKIAKRCILNDNGNREILFEAEHDLIRTRTCKSVESAVEEHSTPVFTNIDKFKPFDKLIRAILAK